MLTAFRIKEVQGQEESLIDYVRGKPCIEYGICIEYTALVEAMGLYGVQDGCQK